MLPFQNRSKLNVLPFLGADHALDANFTSVRSQ